MVGWGGFGEFINCTITGNTSDDGTFFGGLTIGWDGSARLTGGTLSGNRVTSTDLEGTVTGLGNHYATDSIG